MRELPERLTTDQPDYEELLALLDRPQWHRDAACREHPEVNFFPSRGEDGKAAKALCRACLARDACLEAALVDPLTDGIWGGLTPKERRAIRSQKQVA